MSDLIKQKFIDSECECEYDFDCIPYSLYLSNDNNNKIHKDVPNIDIVKELESAKLSNYSELYIPYNKLSVISYGDTVVKITKIPMEYFNDRYNFDRQFITNHLSNYHIAINPIENFNRISIREVFKKT